MKRLAKIPGKIWRGLVRSKFFHLDHIGVVLVGMVVVSALGLLALNMSIFNPLQRAFDDFSMTDIYYELQSGEAMELSDDIVLVDMTELQGRGEIGKAIHEINECKPKVLSVDLIFEKEGEDLVGNAELVEAIEENPNIVFSSKLVDYQPEKDSFDGLVKSFFSDFGDFKFAYGNVYQKHVGGVIRDYTISQKYDGKPFYSLAYQTVCMYTGATPKVQDINHRMIVYGGTDFLVVKAADIKESARLLKDKIVIFGIISGEEDAHFTPVGKMAGMKVQAYSMLSYLKDRHVIQMTKLGSLLLAFVVCYFSAWVGYWVFRWKKLLAVNILNFYYFFLGAFLVWMAFLCWVHFHYNVNLLYPLLGIALVEKGRAYYRGLVNLLYTKKKWKILENSLYVVKE